MADPEYWTTEEVAGYLGVTTSSVRAYLASNRMPAPDQKYGVTNLWRPETIKEWQANRPHKGQVQQ